MTKHIAKLNKIDYLIIFLIIITLPALIGLSIIRSEATNYNFNENFNTSTKVFNKSTKNIQSYLDKKNKDQLQKEKERVIQERISQFEENLIELEDYLGNNNLKYYYGIYFQDLNNPVIEGGYEADKRFYPASIYKIPLAMMVLERAEAGEIDLEKEVPIEVRDEKQIKQKSLTEVMSLMIRESNNDAMGIFERELGGYYKSQKKLEQDFGVKVQRRGQITTPEALGKVFAKLYETGENAYITREHRAFLINEMRAADEWLLDRIPAAVEEYNKMNETNLTSATKIGTLDGVYQDGGFIFGENSDYVLIVMNKNRLTYDAVEEIEKITEIILTGLE